MDTSGLARRLGQRCVIFDNHGVQAAEPPAGQTRPALPTHDPREMLNAWLRALTILGEKHTPPEALELIAAVNQPGTIAVRIRTRLPPDDQHALDQLLGWDREARSRQAGVNILIETVPIRWLTEATGQSWSEIVQRLAFGAAGHPAA